MTIYLGEIVFSNTTWNNHMLVGCLVGWLPDQRDRPSHGATCEGGWWFARCPRLPVGQTSARQKLMQPAAPCAHLEFLFSHSMQSPESSCNEKRWRTAADASKHLWNLLHIPQLILAAVLFTPDDLNSRAAKFTNHSSADRTTDANTKMAAYAWHTAWICCSQTHTHELIYWVAEQLQRKRWRTAADASKHLWNLLRIPQLILAAVLLTPDDLNIPKLTSS